MEARHGGRDRADPGQSLTTDEWLSAAVLAFQSLGAEEPQFDVRGLAEELAPLIPELAVPEPADLAPQAFAQSVSERLRRGPLVVVPPWGKIGPDEPSEVAWLPFVEGLDANPLGIVVPAQTLTGRRVRVLWDALPVTVAPLVVLTGRGWFPHVHRRFESALVLFGPRDTGLLRMFHVPDGEVKGGWLEDFASLMQQQGGTTKYGYVLREMPIGDVLTFARHDPRTQARMRDLSSFGSSVALGELFTIHRSTGAVRVDPAGERGVTASNEQPGVVAARDIGRDGSLAQTLGRLLPGDCRQGIPLEVGDVVMSRVSVPTERSGFRVGEIAPSHLPAVGGGSVYVLRPTNALKPVDRDFVLSYLRSPLARDMLDAVSTAPAHAMSPSDLRNLRVPLPDEALRLAVRELNEATAFLSTWRDDAAELLNGLFDNASAAAARANVLRSGRQIRMRVAAGELLDDFGHTVRTRFPYPIAYRWRSLEAFVSGHDHARGYEAALEAFEVLLCYCAQVGLAMARHAGIQLGALQNIRDRLRTGRSGLGLGDWIQILQEIATGKEFASLAEDAPLSEVRGLLASNDVATEARLRLTKRRNARAHLRSISAHELEEAALECVDDLSILLGRAEFLVDLPLIHIESSRWDSFTRTAHLKTRHLVGDHPVVPYRSLTSSRSDLEDGSLYVADSSGELHLLRPFLTGLECPHCQTWSTFHIDDCPQGSVNLKSLEHGHVISEGKELRALLEIVGML